MPYKALPLPPSETQVTPAFVTASQQSNSNDITTLNDLLNRFPLIARHMQPGLEKLFQQFYDDLNEGSAKHDAQQARRAEEDDNSLERTTSASSIRSGLSRTSSRMSRTLTRTSTYLDKEENYMRGLAETLVMSATDIFQSVDKQQLATLAAATNLSGPVIERMIERYVMEHVHDTVLFPRISSLMSREDRDLEHNFRGMRDVDISQVGIAEGDKHDHSRRVLAGVESFKKMGVAGSPLEMLDVLLQTERCLATRAQPSGVTSGAPVASVVATNADTLVSLLLMVVIRAPIRHLHARLVYMRDFTFIEDVENGELGYALSTFEAVLSYLSSNAKSLRRVSRTNRNLWQAVKQGNLSAIRKALEPGYDGDDSAGDGEISSGETASLTGRVTFQDLNPLEVFTSPTEENTLSHVFPWNVLEEPVEDKPKKKKRVSMDVRSMSNASIHSSRSRSSTVGSTAESITSTMVVDTSPEQLCQTTDELGHSLLMMAVEHNQPRVLKYLLQLDDLIPLQKVLADCDNQQTTLLSAAVQAGQTQIAQVLLDFFLEKLDRLETPFPEYLRLKDSKGRCVAHYLSDAPYLIEELGDMMPWKLKDNYGQTPLFVICRSYDVQAYFELVDGAITAAVRADLNHSGDGILHLDEHVDKKGSTLLHVVNDQRLVRRLLYHCDSDPNACNDKHFTPLMLASKFSRTDLVRIFFGDDRVDLQARDFRGLTAIELAKDDEVRNRIDDMSLLLVMPAGVHQKTTIVRSFFVEDGSIRLVIKSGSRNANNTITVTTCRRSLLDFENLAQWLALEHPASWVPSVFNARSPFQIPSKPSRQMLRDLQLRLDLFMSALFNHATFATHEMLWEFVLVPDIDPAMLADRAHRKAQLRLENLRDGEFPPLLHQDEIRAFELFVQHARQQILAAHSATRSVFRGVASSRAILADIAEAHHLNAAEARRGLGAFLPDAYLQALSRFAKAYSQIEASPTTTWMYALLGTLSATSALLQQCTRPGTIFRALRFAQADYDRQISALEAFPSPSKTGRTPNAGTRFLALLDDGSSASRTSKREAEIRTKAASAKQEMERLGAELRYTQVTVASELAGWQESHAKEVKMQLRELARKNIVVEKERLAALRRVVRGLEKDLAGA
jgi:ankyrin repeat protein